MTAGQQAKQRQEAQDRRQHNAKIAAAIKKSTDEETKERGKAAVQARQQRKAWQDQEDKLAADADTKAGRKHDKARGDIEKKKSDTDTRSTSASGRQREDHCEAQGGRGQGPLRAGKEAEPVRRLVRLRLLGDL